jgi:hypothetical protein
MKHVPAAFTVGTSPAPHVGVELPHTTRVASQLKPATQRPATQSTAFGGSIC